jgi:hypothetical protein
MAVAVENCVAMVGRLTRPRVRMKGEDVWWRTSERCYAICGPRGVGYDKERR